RHAILPARGSKQREVRNEPFACTDASRFGQFRCRSVPTITEPVRRSAALRLLIVSFRALGVPRSPIRRADQEGRIVARRKSGRENPEMNAPTTEPQCGLASRQIFSTAMRSDQETHWMVPQPT